MRSTFPVMSTSFIRHNTSTDSLSANFDATAKKTGFNRQSNFFNTTFDRVKFYSNESERELGAKSFQKQQIQYELLKMKSKPVMIVN